MRPIQLCCVKDCEVSQAVNSQGQALCARGLQGLFALQHIQVMGLSVAEEQTTEAARTH